MQMGDMPPEIGAKSQAKTNSLHSASQTETNKTGTYLIKQFSIELLVVKSSTQLLYFPCTMAFVSQSKYYNVKVIYKVF